MRPPHSTSANFVVRGGGNDFANRQKLIFEQLSQAAKECNKDKGVSSLSQTDMEILNSQGGSRRSLARPVFRQRQSEMRQYRGKESIFKRPEGPAPVARRDVVPDHFKNPHKWVKYSLEDVPDEHMSERSNTLVAFAILNELRARKEKERCKTESEDKMDTDEPDGDGSHVSTTGCKFTTRIPFRKSTDSRDKKEPLAVVVERDDRPVFRNSKIIMPEYVVGQKPERKVKKTRPVVKIDRSKQLKLAHLDESDN